MKISLLVWHTFNQEKPLKLKMPQIKDNQGYVITGKHIFVQNGCLTNVPHFQQWLVHSELLNQNKLIKPV